MKYKDYYNFELGNRDIYSHNDILGMTVQVFDQELPLSYQYNTIGIPKDDELMNSPNTHQYTNANGRLRWRSSSKTTEDLLEEERRRNQELQSQMQSAQSQLTAMQPQESIQPKSSQTQAVESPMLDDNPFLNSDAVNALSGFAKLGLQKLKTRKQEENGTVSDETVPTLDELHRNLKSAIGNGSENPFDPSTQVLEGAVKKSNLKERMKGSFENLAKAINVKEKWRNFQETGFNKDDDLNLKEEMKDRYDILINNKTDYSAPMTPKEKFTDAIVQEGFKHLFPSSSDVYTDGMTNFSRARNNPNAKVLENMEILDENTQKVLLNAGVNSNERGVYYDSNSKIAKKFAKSPEVKKFFKDNENLIKQGVKNSQNFNFDASLKDLLLNPNKIDRYGSLQHAKMIDAYYDEKGNKHGRFIDNVDYERRFPKGVRELPKTYMNNHGVNMQEKGNFENYYTVMDIILKETLKEKLKRKLRH